SMMPSAVHFSICGTSSVARKRLACSSSRIRSSVIHEGRGTCRESIGLLSFLASLAHPLPRRERVTQAGMRNAAMSSAALIVHQMGRLVLEPFVAGHARQRVDA